MRRHTRFHQAAPALVAGLLLATGLLQAQPLTITHFAGPTAGPGWFDGTGSAAQFNGPMGVAVDGAGNIYLADTGNHTIRKVTPEGAVTTFAGTATFHGSNDGKGSAARFRSPRGIAVDSSGTVYVADTGNHVVRKITPDGVVSTIAGLAGISGSADGTGSAARFDAPEGVAADGTGYVWVTDRENFTVRRISPSGTVVTVAGLAGDPGGADGTGSAAGFWDPSGIAVDEAGNAWVVDASLCVIRKVTSAGVVTTIAGGKGQIGSADGTGTAARFLWPNGICVDRSGNLYVTDTLNQTVRRITPSGAVSTLAGKVKALGSNDGRGTGARFNTPLGIGVDGAGNVYVADSENDLLRKVAGDGVVSTLAGWGGTGSADGAGSDARFNRPAGLAVDGAGNVFVADSMNHTIRKVTPDGVVSTLAGEAGVSGSSDGAGAAGHFNTPMAVAVDPAGNVYVTDSLNHTVRKVTADGIVSTVAGKAGSEGEEDGEGAAARFDEPQAIAVDEAGNLWVGQGSSRLRKISPAGLVSTPFPTCCSESAGIGFDSAGGIYLTQSRGHRIIQIRPDGGAQTVAGGFYGAGSRDDTGHLAQFDTPAGLARDGSGTLWVADSGNRTIRKVTPAGVVSTVAGQARVPGSSDGTGSEAGFDEPWGIARDSSGIVYIADRSASCIRRGVVVPTLADVATIDSPFGFTGEARRLGTAPQTATAWLWEVVRRPSGSTASLSATDAPSPAFTPDVPDLYVFRLTASDASGRRSVSTVSLTARAPGPSPGQPVTRLLPIVLDVTAGPAHYTTELALTNNSTSLLPISILYTASLGSRKGSGTVTGLLGPGEQRRIGDVLSWLREKGLAIPSAAEEAQQGGTLLVSFDGAGAVDPKLVSATARTAAFTSSPQPTGRAGLAYSGLLSGEAQASPVTVYGLRSTPADRTNLAVFNSFIEPVTVKVTVCSGSGDGRCVLFRPAETLPPLGWVQYGSAQLLDANGIEQGWAVVESTSTGSFGAYAVVNDNVTNDGSFVLPGGGPLMGSTLIVPVLVETGPFRSELTLANKSPNRVTLRLKYVESMTPSTGPGGTVSLALEPFEQRIIPEAIDFLRRSGASIGPPDPYPNHGGALRVTASGAEVDKLFAGARTSARSTASTGGQFGLFTPGVYPGQTASTEAYLYGLRRDAENRTNVAVVNAGSDSDGPIGIVFEVFDADDAGRPKAARYGYWAIAPGEWEQIDNIFRFTGVSNGWVKVTRTSGTAPWFAYAVVNDGGSSGERTGDGAYVPMVK